MYVYHIFPGLDKFWTNIRHMPKFCPAFANPLGPSPTHSPFMAHPQPYHVSTTATHATLPLTVGPWVANRWVRGDGPKGLAKAGHKLDMCSDICPSKDFYHFSLKMAHKKGGQTLDFLKSRDHPSFVHLQGDQVVKA